MAVKIVDEQYPVKGTLSHDGFGRYTAMLRWGDQVWVQSTIEASFPPVKLDEDRLREYGWTLLELG